MNLIAIGREIDMNSEIANEMLEEITELRKIVSVLAEKINSLSDKNTEYLTNKQMADFLKISVDQLKQHVKNGTLKIGRDYLDNASKDAKYGDYRFNAKQVEKSLSVPREKRK